MTRVGYGDLLKIPHARWGKGGSIVYLINDEFTTDEAAPITTPRTAEPGPGSWLVASAASFSVTGGRLVRSGTGTLRSIDTYARDVKALYGRMNYTSGSTSSLGFSADGSSTLSGFQIGSNTTPVANGAGIGLIMDQILLGAWVDFLIVSRPTIGYLFFVRGANYGRWRLAWVSVNDNTANPYVVMVSGAASVGESDNFILTDAPGDLGGAYGMATHYEAAPTSGAYGSGAPSMLSEITWTPASGEILELSVKELDANNKVFVRCNQTTSVAVLIEKIAGVEHTLQSVAATWTIGTPYRIVLTAYYAATGIRVATLVNSAAIHYRSLSNNTVLDYAIGSSASGFATAANYAIWPSETDVPSPFDDSRFNWVFAYGDSKTAMRYKQARLTDLLENETGSRWACHSIGVPGLTVAHIAARVATDMANIPPWLNPSMVLINLGTNDAGSLPTEETWKANYRTIIETIHGAMPNATIYLEKPVRLSGAPASSPLASVATMHAYIDDLITEYAYVSAGLNETALENGDGYVTYFGDALHPNTAGYLRCGELALTAMGY